jgi:DNA-binding NarL/FixJ family response regulator
VILLTTFAEDELLPKAVKAGAQGFLLKDASPEDLCEAISRVGQGHTLLQPISLGSVRARWQAGAGQDAHGSPGVQLTERERSLLRLVAGGYSNKEIGRTLHLSEGTVKNYMSEILSKLDCRDRTHAVLTAITQRLI